MAVIKCKMCGGDMEISADKTFGTCEYCGSTMTLPKVSDDQRAAAFNRGNHFRRAGEFDKALGVYERIVAEDDTDAEAHWCCALCRFGIEYVEDPATYEWLPTCHRASFDSFLEDVDYLAALEHSDGITRRQYQKDAAKIAEVQRGILATSQNTEPYDVFISYKELDENGERTRDSVLAQDIYYQLTEQGRRVFFSRISLEDIPGTQYEPYIFAALNSAKVMIVVGTSAENLNAVWVKNEWSRFLAMMRKDKTKLLIPCYRDMDPYDMPEQLTVLMSYDMGKIGFIQDLIRGVNKVLDADQPKEKETVHETVVVKNKGGANTDALLKRGNMALEYYKWDDAKSYFDRVLDMDAECAEAYLGLFLAGRERSSLDNLSKGQPYAWASALEYETLTACPEDTAHIEKSVVENVIVGRLTADKIRELYAFDRTYSSAFDSAKWQMLLEKEAISIDMNLASAKKYADSKLSAQIAEVQQKLFAWLDENVENCQREDKENAERISAEYAKHLDAVDKKIRALREENEKAKREHLAAMQKKADERIRMRMQIFERIETEDKINIIAAHNQEKESERSDLIQRKAEIEENYAVLKGLQKHLAKNKVERQLSDLDAEICAIENDIADISDVSKYDISAYVSEDYISAYRRNNPLCAFRQMQIMYMNRETISAGGSHTVALNPDGTVVATKYTGNYYAGQCDVHYLTAIVADIVAVSAGVRHTAGLKADGTVVALGDNDNGQCNAYSWRDIVAVSAGRIHTVGLKTDGTVVAVGDNDHGQCNVDDWTDIIAVSAGGSHTVGLKADGTVVATKYIGEQSYHGQCNVDDWTDIIAVSAGSNYTVGLKIDGTVVAVGSNDYGQCNVDSWSDIVAVSAGGHHAVGLKADGTVVATKYTGKSYNGQCNVDGWSDIVAISAGLFHTVGLKADGTAVATKYTGKLYHGECNVDGWSGIKVPEK